MLRFLEESPQEAIPWSGCNEIHCYQESKSTYPLLSHSPGGWSLWWLLLLLPHGDWKPKRLSMQTKGFEEPPPATLVTHTIVTSAPLAYCTLVR